MSNAPIGNEQNMAQVREMMQAKALADEVNMGAQATDVIEVDYTSEDTGKRYQGKIKFKRPSVMDTLKMGGRKTQLLRDAGVVDKSLVDDGILAIATAMTTLEVVAVKCPEWLIDMEKLDDADLIFHVYGRYMAWNYTFRLANTPVQEANSQPSAGEKAMGTP